MTPEEAQGAEAIAVDRIHGAIQAAAAEGKTATHSQVVNLFHTKAQL